MDLKNAYRGSKGDDSRKDIKKSNLNLKNIFFWLNI